MRSAFPAVALAAGGGLVLAGATVADWLRTPVSRTVGDVVVAEEVVTPGTELAAPLVAVGLAALLAALALMVLPSAARRGAGLLLVVLGMGGAVGVVDGLRRALVLDGAIAQGPGIAGLGALLVLGGGALVVRRPRQRPALPPRFALDDAEREDDEWRLASVEDDG